MTSTRNIIISGTNFWNPGDDFVRDGVITILKELFPSQNLNFLFYNFNADFFPYTKFSGISNTIQNGDLDKYKDHVDFIIIAGLSAGIEIKDLYNWILKNNLQDRVYLIGAGYENDYVDKYVSQEPEASIFRNAKIITGRTQKRPQFIDQNNLNYYHINCPAILSVPEVKEISKNKNIERIGFSIQLPQGVGIQNQHCSTENYNLATDILVKLSKDYEVEIVAHHKTEYFFFLDKFKNYNIPVIFSSFYQDLSNVYPRYDLLITTRLHSSLYANGYGIPGIIINNTDRHTHCLEGFPHSVWVNSFSGFEKEFKSLIQKDLHQISIQANEFKKELLNKYLKILSGPFGVNWKANNSTNSSRKMNLGCGFDYREGYINVDGNAKLPKVDYVLDIKPGSLQKVFDPGFLEEIVAKDFIEHHFHWEARQLLEDFYCILGHNGRLEMTLPNIEMILADSTKPLKERMMWLYGGQDIGTPYDDEAHKVMRQKYASYFCHKFGWTKETITEELKSVGFKKIKIEDQGWNMRVISIKEADSNPEDKQKAVMLNTLEPEFAFNSEQKEQMLVRSRIHEGMTVLDVGANIGKYTKLFSHLVGKNGKVYAFEPSTFAFKKLTKEKTDKNLDNVLLFKNAIYSENTTITLNEFPEEYCSWNSIGKPQMKKPETHDEFVPIVNSVDVEAVTLDAFCKKNKIKTIDYLKLDVEGAEIFALKGASNLLKNKAIKNLQFEISKQMLEGLETSAKEVFDYLADYGYRCYKITEDGKIGGIQTDSQEFYENYIALPVKEAANDLPVNFFTIVLNGKPFIEKHIDIMKKLPFRWHWHIVEGVADLKHDTAWSLKNGARIIDDVHENGLSIDGTSKYLDKLVKDYPDNISVYRKGNGQFWDGKLEMVNAPLPNIAEESLLWQLDVDEFWLPWQISKVRDMFNNNSEKTAAWFYCYYFVGPNLITNTIDTYGNKSSYEWLRVWRFHPQDRFESHEPPQLIHHHETGQSVDQGKHNPFYHQVTEENGLVFEHYAYILDNQLTFKENYYGYKDALSHWQNLQKEKNYPVLLKDYFPWLDDQTRIVPAGYIGLKPLLQKSTKNTWKINEERLNEQENKLNLLSYLETHEEKNILWIRPDSIGDAVISMDMISKFKDRYPETKITVVCQNHLKEVYEVHDSVDEIIGFNRNELLNESPYQQEVISKLQQKRAFLAVNPVFSRDIVGDFLTLNSNAVHSIAFEGDNSNLNEEIRQNHNQLYSILVPVNTNITREIDRSGFFLSSLGIENNIVEPRIYLHAEDEDYADNFFKRNNLDPGKTIILVAGAQHEIRYYYYYGQALSEICKNENYCVVALGGKNEYELNQKNLNAIPVKTFNLCGKTTVRQAAALVKKCKLVLGSETSITHIAAAFSVPHVVLLGGGHFGRFMPYHKSTVMATLSMACFGCNWKCQFDEVKCVKHVPSGLLKYALEQQLNEPNKKARIYLPESSYSDEVHQHLQKLLNRDNVELNYVSIENDVTEQSKGAHSFNSIDLSSYFQPQAGNTEKYIDVKPNSSIGAPLSSFQALKNYDIRDFGTGLDAVGSILGHVVINKFKKQWAGKSDFWYKTLVVPVKCSLFDKISGKKFSESKPQTLKDISAEFDKTEQERVSDEINYAGKLEKGEDLGTPLYVTGKALNELMQQEDADEKGIYILDGSRRITGHAIAHIDEINIQLIMHEEEYASLIDNDKISALKQKMESLSWFNNYQSIPVAGLKGERSTNRFNLMDMTILQDQTVMDFGCNIGQACIKAIQAGAKQVYGIEGMSDTWSLAQDIKNISGFANLHYENVDFNHQNFDDMIDQICPGKVDYAFFFSVYRTKELKQRDRLFRYIIDKTKKGIFFEGHAAPKIDSIEYYDWLFESFGLKYTFLGYSEGNIRPLFYIPLQEQAVSKPAVPDSIIQQGVSAIQDDQEYDFLVSAIVSTYKSAHFIQHKLDDLLNQTLGSQVEIIVIDSNSPENEEELVKPYLEKYSNIKYIKTEKRETVYQAWNRGIKMASGKYLTNSNTDDRLKSNALEIMVKELENDPSVALIYADFFITGYENMTFENHIRTGYSVKPDYHPNIMLHGCHMGPQPVWRAAIHKKTGYFSDELKAAGDYEFWCRMAAAGFKLKHIPQFLGLYLHNASGIINSNKNLADQESAIVREQYKKKLPTATTHLPTGFYHNEPVVANKYVNISMVTYNRLEFTRSAIKSILAYTRFPYILTVVDNNSSDGTKQYLQEMREKGVINNLILLDENVGVAKASNIGWYQEPEAQYYMKYDNDIVIQKENWLRNMVQVADNIPKTGMVGYNFEPNSYPLTNEFGLNIRIKSRGNLGGALVLIPKSTESILGKWCEDYGLYGEEDADYGYRISLAGMLNIYMEDENIGLHLPAGKAAAINADTLVAKDGIEETQDTEYRNWKDEQRKYVVHSGKKDLNFNAYKTGEKPLFIEPGYDKSLVNANKNSENIAKDNEPVLADVQIDDLIEGKPKITFLALEKHAFACPQIRLNSPLANLHKTGIVEYRPNDFVAANNSQINIDELLSCNIVIIQRNLAQEIPYKKLKEVLKDKPVKIVFEFDDALDRLPGEHPAFDYYQKMTSNFHDYISNADLVTVSTEKLKTYYSHLSKKIVVLPNALNSDIWKPVRTAKKQNKKIRILFAGTTGHEQDLALIEKDLKKILTEYESKVELLLWGNINPELQKLPNVTEVDQFKTSYIQYADILKKMQVDIAIVPLKKNPFNDAKSHIKWLEYSACGIPGIFSDVPAYSNHIVDKKTGLLVKEKPNAWYKALKQMIDNPKLRKSIRRAAGKEVWNNHMLENHVHLWEKAYTQLLTSQKSFDVSIIIPVFNKVEYTQKCIESIFRNTKNMDYEVLIVDNASVDGTGKYLKRLEKEHQNVRCIFNKKNVGFAKANNQAAGKAKGQYLLFLNNDTEVLPGWLEGMVNIAEKDSSVGAVGCKLLYPDETIQHAGVVLINDKKGNDPLLAQNIFVGSPKDEHDANNPREYQAVTAACMLASKTAFLSVDGFDEEFWNGYEDVDLCFKLREAGYKVVYQPESVAIHFESKSGPERFLKVSENIKLLHDKWRGKVKVDFIIDEKGDVKESKVVNIKPYASEATQSVNEKGPVSGLVSIIILTCNALDYTKKCVQSIQKSTSYPHEIIFVDNNSQDGTQQYLKDLIKKNPHYKLIENKTNKGFAAGNNQAVKRARGEFVFFLNNDVLVAENWLKDMVSALGKDERIGMIGPLTNSISGLQQLDNVPYKNDSEFYNFAADIRESFTGQVTPRRRIAGFAILMRKDLYVNVNGFDETFGIGNFEDDDLCLKVRDKGYAIMVHEGTFIHHYGSQSFKANKINILKTLEDKGQIFGKRWPKVDYDELLEIKNPLHKLHPDLIKKATNHLEHFESEEAIELFGQVLTDNPISGEALFGIALALRMQNETEEALEYLHSAYRLFPENVAVLNQLGIIAFEMNHLDKAQNYFGSAIINDPGFLDAKRNYGQVLIEQGDYENGVVAFTKILDKNPDDILSLNYMAGLYLEVERFEQALKFCEKTLSIDPNNPEALDIKNKILHPKQSSRKNTNNILEEAYLLLNNFDIDQAEKKFEESLKEQDNPDAFFGLALCATQKDQEIKTMNLLNKIIEKWPDYAAAYNQMGMIYFNNKEFRNANNAFAKAIEKDAELIEAQRNYGLSLIELEDYQNGIAVFNKIIEKHPDDVETLLIVAGFYCEISKWDKAEGLVKSVLNIDSENEQAKEYNELIKKKPEPEPY